MNLVYAIDNLGSGGAQRQVAQLALHLHERADVRVSVLVYHDLDFHGDRLRAAGVPVVRLRKGLQVDPLLPLRIRRWHRAHRPDLVHAFLPLPCLWHLLGVRATPRRERPVFVAAERSAFDDTSAPHALGRRLAYPRADAVTVNAQRMVADVAERLRVPRERLHYLPNGIDLEAWDAEAAGAPPFALEPGRFHLGLVGGLRREKNHLTVLEALERLGPEKTHDWRVWFVGGETGEPDYARAVRDAITRRRLGGIVRIVPPVQGVAALMRRLDGVLLPSSYEGFPNVVLEAMASGVPCVASAVGDVPNMLEDGRSGLVLERVDPDAVADALGRLHTMAPAERAALGAHARRSVDSRYAMPVVAARYLDLYRALVAGTPPRAA